MMRNTRILCLLSLIAPLLLQCTTTYSTVRKKTESQLNKSHAIPLDLIEPAHFLNCYRQTYPAPENESLSFMARTAEEGETTILELGIRAEASHSRARRPLNLCLVIDKSRSMHDAGKMEQAKEAVREIVRLLRPEDVVSIVVYDSNASVILEPSPAVDREAALLPVENVIASGGSNGEAGILLGLRQLDRRLSRERVNRMILIADSGIDDVTNVLQTETRRAALHGIIFSVIGIGPSFYDPFLYKLSAESGGHYYVAALPGESLRAANEEMASTLYAPADNIRLLLVLKEGVRLDQVYGYAIAPEQPLNIRINVFPQMACGATQTVLLRLKIPAGTDLYATATLFYRDSLAFEEKSKEIFLRTKRDPADEFPVRRNLAIAREALAIREARAAEKAQDYPRSIAAIDGAIKELHTIHKSREDEEIANDINRLIHYHKNLDASQKAWEQARSDQK